VGGRGHGGATTREKTTEKTREAPAVPPGPSAFRRPRGRGLLV